MCPHTRSRWLLHALGHQKVERMEAPPVNEVKSSQVKSSQVKSLNTIVIDHLRSEYSAWVDLLRRGHSGLRSAYGKDYLNHFMGGRERVCESAMSSCAAPSSPPMGALLWA